MIPVTKPSVHSLVAESLIGKFRRLGVALWSVLLSGFLGSSWIRTCIATDIQGDVQSAKAVQDAIAATRAQLAQGRATFEASLDRPHIRVRIRGTYTWDGSRVHFLGSIANVRSASGADVQEVAASDYHDMELIETDVATVWYDRSRRHMYHGTAANHRPESESLFLPYYPHEAALCMRPIARKRLEDHLGPADNVLRWEAKPGADQTLTVTREMNFQGCIQTIVADWSRAGNVTALDANYRETGQHEFASVDWRQHPSGVWYPSEVEIVRQPGNQKSFGPFRYWHRISDFDPRPIIATDRFNVSSLSVPKGTYIFKKTDAGEEERVLGGISANRAVLEERLRGAAREARSAGFGFGEEVRP